MNIILSPFVYNIVTGRISGDSWQDLSDMEQADQGTVVDKDTITYWTNHARSNFSWFNI